MRRDILERLMAAGSSRVAMALVTRLRDGRQALVEDVGVRGDLELDEPLADAIRALLVREFCGHLPQDQGLFVRVYAGPLRLLVVGAGPIARALAPMAALAGFEVTVIDPRPQFAGAGRFSEADFLADTPQHAMAQMPPDDRTAVVTLSHDPAIDDPALLAALQSPAFYIGALASARTHARRMARLAELGFGGQAARIFSPVGLSLGGRAPAEIAVATLAQIVQQRHRGAPA
jgi:xanthine dehydrogenase accessory factor